MPGYNLSSCFMLLLVSTNLVKIAPFRLLSHQRHRLDVFNSVQSGASFLTYLESRSAFERDTKRTLSIRAMVKHRNPSQSFSTDLSQSNKSFQGSDDNDVSKWEKMYYSPGQTPSKFSASDDDLNSKPTTSDVRIITFDLDNTLWKTGPTISYANKILNEHMKTMGVDSDSLVEVEMGRLFNANKKQYAGDNFIEENNNEIKSDNLASIAISVGETKEEDGVIGGKMQDDLVHIGAESKNKKIQPVYLTMLRKDAIRCLLQLHSNPSIDANRLEEEVDKAFQLWMDARTESINENYADNVLSTLSKIRSSIIPSSKFGKLYIGAITDGNSDPMSVPSIREYFDFVIRAEDVGVSKPDGKVYKAAVGELLVNLMRDGFNVETFFLGESSHDDVGYGPAAYIGPSAKSWRDVEEETIETFSEAVGPWWIHVGDDFFKDIVASKSFGMRSIWVRELIAKNQSIITAKETSIQQKVERTVQDLENEKEDGVLKMAIGESKFLASTLHEEFSDAILEKFEQLENLLIGWHEEGLKEQAELDSTFESQVPEAIDTLQGVEVVHPSRSVPVSASQTEDNKKFCVFCGALLPPVAKFCSSCGEKQP